MLPSTEISSSAWERMVAELERVYPAEGLAVPLLALTHRDPAANPCAPVGLTDLAHLTIAQVVLVPARLQRNSAVRVTALPSSEQLVNTRVEQLALRHPRLRACAYLHSHPFATGSTSPSRGPSCDVDGHMRPMLEHNRTCGLLASFSFIACREAGTGGWLLQGFAMNSHGAVCDLGFAKVIADQHPAVRAALHPPLSARFPQRCVLRRWRRELRRRRLPHRCDELFDGWTRIVVALANGRRAVVLIPIDFPESPVRCFTSDPAGRSSQPFHPARPLERDPGAWAALACQLQEGIHACA